MALWAITLPAWPAWKAPTVTTARWAGATLRATTLCSAITREEPATTGSMACSGKAPWPPLPVISTSQLSTAAMVSPSVK